MDNFTVLSIPYQAQVQIDPTPKECPSEGFDYPNFRLLNKKARIRLSNHLNPRPSAAYRLFAVANSQGWFAATNSSDTGNSNSSSSVLVFSPLADLRSALQTAEEDSENNFTPKRSLFLSQGKPTIITFAYNETRLLVGIEDGSILVYDTAALFSVGTDEITPLHTSLSTSEPVRQIAPNPGAEQNLADIVAIVRRDGTVQLVNTQLENRGGWSSPDPSVAPVSVSWSPRGKHLAIGLRTGDLLTFALNNMSTHNKHIPPTADAFLVSLNWTGPAHTFRTTYAPKDPSTGDPVHHIITVDTKSSTATYMALTHPFTLPDRPQNGYEIALPKWDLEAGEVAQPSREKTLFVVGDTSSVDLEVIANAGNQWYQQSQENPLTLPLDKNQDDTMLLSLDVDLTDIHGAGFPIMYAYLNDGTVQGWYIEHSKPYTGMISPGGTLPQTSALGGQNNAPTQKPPATSAFGQSAFGQSAFGQSSASAFGQSSLAQEPISAFEQPQQTSSTFGSSGGGFGAYASGTSGFGSLSGAPQAATGTSVFGGGGPLHSGSTSAFGGSAFGGGSTQSSTASVFGSGSPKPATSTFGGGFSQTNTPSAFGGSSTQPNTTSAFGGGPTQLSTTSVFGGLGSRNYGSSSSGAFGGLSSSGSVNAFGTGTFGGSSTATPAEVSAITREASMQDSTPSFGGLGGLSLGGGSDSDSQPRTNSVFGSFSTTPAAITTPASNSGGVVKPALGFGAFGSQASQPQSSTTTSEPGKHASTSSTSTASSAFGQSGFGQPGFGQSGFGAKPAFGQSAFGQPAFGQSSLGNVTPVAKAAPASGGFGAYASTPSMLTSGGGGFGAFANAPASFNAGARVSSSDVVSTGSAGVSDQAKPPPISNSAPPALGGGSVFGERSSPSTPPFGGSRVESVMAPRETNNPLAKPAQSPPSSPEPDSSRPASTFKSTTLAPTTGAFGNLQSTPSMFKPATGFGAFGGDNIPASSPFLKKPEQQAPVSVFSSLASTTSPAASTSPSSSPAFGSTSALGAPKSAFRLPAPPSPTLSMTPTTGGFGAFSGSSTSAFGAFAGSKKSFSDLLKSDVDSKDPVKPSTSTATSPLHKPEAKPVPVSVFGPPSSPISVFGTSKPETSTIKEESKTSISTKAAEEEKPSPTEVPEVKTSTLNRGSSGTISDEPVDISISSTGSSFVEVNADAIEDGSFEEPHIEEEEGEGSDDEDDDADSFLSSDVGSHGSSDVSDDEGSDDDYQPSRSPSPMPEATAVPLPESRSPSATPQPDIPKIEVTPSPSPSEQVATSSASSEREASTTPPGTPVKEVKSVFSKPPATVPTTTSSAPVTPSPFGIGLGRPSTRPTRSSPLASAPVSGDDENEPREVQIQLMKPPVSPKPVFGALPSKIDVPVKAESDEESTSPTAKRPKTPPLLSSFGSSKSPAIPSTPVLAHAIPPGQRPATTPATSSTKPSVPSSAPNVASETTKPPPSSPAPSSFFGKQPEINRPVTSPGLTSLFGTPPTPGTPPISPPAPSSVFSMPQFSLTGPGTPVPGGHSLDKGPVPAPQPVEPSTLDKGKGGATDFGTTGFFGKLASAPQPLESSALDQGKGGMPDLTTTGFFSKPASAPQPLSGFFGKPASAPQPSTGFFGKPSPASPSTTKPSNLSPASPLPGQPPVTPSTTIPPPPELTMEEGMQKECAMLVMNLNKDLESLHKLAQEASKKLTDLKKPAGGSHTKSDLSDPSKWALNDVVQFGEMLKQYVHELKELKENRERERQSIRDLQSQMVKAGTRREEIARFNKAKTDADFAKMLKTRTLGPEHLETQTQLRRNIQNMRNRIQQLEANLQASKKKLVQASSGQPGLRAPSLDTINRTYRNIDTAVQQQANDVAQLARRIEKLSVSTITDSPNGRDPRLPDVVSNRPYNITPHVAVTTAAALNAERSAHRLKRALLSVRKEPLLNTKASAASPAPMLFNTPQKPGSSLAFGFQTPPPVSLFPIAASNQTPETPPSNWTLPPGDDFSPTPWTPTQRRGAGTGQKKHGSVPLKRTPGASPTPAAASFDWGPLPMFNNAPLNALAAGVKITPQTPPK